MTFSGLFAIGLSGVNAFSNGLEAISQNIANTQTTGYKRARTDFSTLVAANAPDGGIEGGGVSSNNRTIFAQQGAITRSASPTDLAISGDGFFVVSNSPDANATAAFTRSGNFSALESGQLVNEAGYFLKGALVDDNGQASLGGVSGLEIVNINRVPSLSQATDLITLGGTLSANALAGETFTRNVEVIDADGNARTIALTFTANGTGNFDAVAAFQDGGNETVASGTIVFDGNGRIDRGASGFPFAFTTNAGESVEIDVSLLSSRDGASQFTTITANGAAPGELTGVTISRDGRVTAQFSNGLTRDIYQVTIANFVNAEALDEGASSTFLQTSAAGALSLDVPQSGRAGAIEGGALELSTVDIGQEFSALIETQRAYSANTRIISTADELWQILTQTAR